MFDIEASGNGIPSRILMTRQSERCQLVNSNVMKTLSKEDPAIDSKQRDVKRSKKPFSSAIGFFQRVL